MRKGFQNFQPKIINYRFYNRFPNEAYTENLVSKNFVNNDDGFQRFCDMILATINKHVHVK